MPLEFFPTKKTEKVIAASSSGSLHFFEQSQENRDQDGGQFEESCSSNTANSPSDPQENIFPLLKLPPEILKSVLTFLDPKSVLNFRLTHKNGRDLFPMEEVVSWILQNKYQLTFESPDDKKNTLKKLSKAAALYKIAFKQHEKFKTPLHDIDLFNEAYPLFKELLPKSILLNIPMASFGLYGLGRVAKLKDAIVHLKDVLQSSEMKLVEKNPSLLQYLSLLVMRATQVMCDNIYELNEDEKEALGTFNSYAQSKTALSVALFVENEYRKTVPDFHAFNCR